MDRDGPSRYAARAHRGGERRTILEGLADDSGRLRECTRGSQWACAQGGRAIAAGRASNWFWEGAAQLGETCVRLGEVLLEEEADAGGDWLGGRETTAEVQAEACWAGTGCVAERGGRESGSATWRAAGTDIACAVWPGYG